MNVFVTGATGYLGSRLVRELIKRQCCVYALVRSGDANGAFQRLANCLHQNAGLTEAEATPYLTAMAGDLLDLPEAMDSVDVVLHAAAEVKLKGGKQVLQTTNVEGTARIIDWSRRRNAKHFLYISTAYVVGRPDEHRTTVSDSTPYFATVNNEYEASKRSAELLVAAHCPSFTILRPSVLCHRQGFPGRDALADNPIGFHGWLDLVTGLKRLCRGKITECRIKANPHATLNMTNVDQVVEQVADYVSRGNYLRNAVCQLVSAEAVGVGDILSRTADYLHPLNLVPQTNPQFNHLSSIERRYESFADFFHAYVTQDVRFQPSEAWHQGLGYPILRGLDLQSMVDGFFRIPHAFPSQRKTYDERTTDCHI